MTTRFAKFEFQRGKTDAAAAGKVVGRAEVALYDGQCVTDEVIDAVFCKRWNLPPPNLIISVTGSAQDWVKSPAPPAAPVDSHPPSDTVLGSGVARKENGNPPGDANAADALAEQVAIARFIKNCVYASAVESRCCWVMSGGSNAGVMRLLGDARRLLGGWGDDTRLGSALVPVIGVGVASKMKYYGTVLKNMPAQESPEAIALQYEPGVFESCRDVLFRSESNGEGGTEKVSLYVPDPGHSHLLYLGSESGKWGDEVKQRVEAEEYLSAKFKAPVVYIVLGGGPVTVQMVQDCIQKEALTVVVKGSGRAADVIAEYAKNRCIHSQNHGGSPLFWKLHGEQINGKKGEEGKEENIEANREYRLQEFIAKYLTIVNSKFLAIFDPEVMSYDAMCSRIRAVAYVPSKHTFNSTTLENMRQHRHISHGVIAKNSGFEVQGFFMGTTLARQQQPSASTPIARHNSVSAAAEPHSPYVAAAFPRAKAPSFDDHVPQLRDVAAASLRALNTRDDFTDMFVSMMRRYGRHANAPDVFVTLLLALDNPEVKDSPCVQSVIEGLGAASHTSLIWMFLNLNPNVSHNIMRRMQDLRMACKASHYSSVIAFSDSDLQHSGHFTRESSAKMEALQGALDECARKGGGGSSIVVPKDILTKKRIMSGVDEVFFVANGDCGEKFENEYRVKQHVALRLQAETHISDVFKTSGLYVVCGGDLKQVMSDLQWCCSQRCHFMVMADSGGLCTALMHAICLHKGVLTVADKMLQLCRSIAGAASESRNTCFFSIENTIVMCLKVLEKIDHQDVLKVPGAYAELQRITEILVPDEQAHDYMEGLYPGRAYEPQDRQLRRKSVSIMNARRVFAPNQVHPEAAAAAPAKVEARSLDQHEVLTKCSSLLHEHCARLKREDPIAQNPYVLLPSVIPSVSSAKSRRTRSIQKHNVKPEEDNPFLVTAKRALANLRKLPWHAAVVLQLREANPLLPPMSFDDSVSAIVNLVEKCSVSVVFSPVAARSDTTTGIDSSKLVAQCVLRRAIESPSVAMGHPSVDMFGETCLMVAVSSGSRERVAVVLDSPGVDVHYICRSSSHPAAFGVNALLVALMLQLPDIAEAIVDKLLQLLANPLSTVHLRDDIDQQRSNDGAGIGKIKHSVKTVTLVDYIQTYNATLIQDCLSARHPECHITALMFACRWGYARLLPKFLQLVKLQEDIKACNNPDHDDAVLPLVTPFMRHKIIAQSLVVVDAAVSSDGFAGGELAEASSQLEFKMLLLGDHNSDFGIDVNGRSALHHAVSSGSAACVRFCMDLGADALRTNKKYTYSKVCSSGSSDAASVIGRGVEFQDEFEIETRMYCGFSAQELRYLQATGEFEAYKMNLNPELSSAIDCTMLKHSLDTFLPSLRDMVQRDSVSSVALRTEHPHSTVGVHVLLTKSVTALDAALFSWGIHGIYFDRKKLELETELREQSFKKDVLVQQHALMRLKTHRNLMQGCVDALEGSDVVSAGGAESAAGGDAGDVAFSSRGSIVVREFIRNKAYHRIIMPIVTAFALIGLLFIFCSLINAGMSPRETRSFVETTLRGVRDTYMDVAGGSGTMRLRTLDDVPQFMTGIEPFLTPPDDAQVQRLGHVRVSFMFEERRACKGLTAGSCVQHYEDGAGYSSGAIDLAVSEQGVWLAATSHFMNFSQSVGGEVRRVRDCGYVYCFDAPAVQLLLPASATFKPAWSSLKALLPQLSALRFLQLGFVLHSPAIEQSIAVRLLLEVGGVADVSVHDRFTSFRIAPDVPFWHLSSQPLGILSVILFISCSVLLLRLLLHFARDRHERVAPQQGVVATYRRCLPIIFSSPNRSLRPQSFSAQNSHPVNVSVAAASAPLYKADGAAATSRLQALGRLVSVHAELLKAFAYFLLSHQGISAMFCVLSFAVLLLNLTIHRDMKAIFNVGEAPKDAALYTHADIVTPLLDGAMQSLEYRMSSLRDLMAFALLIVFATLLKHLERLPVLGPKLCAITAVLCDSVVIVFVAFIFIVSAAYAMAAFVGYSLDTSDRNDVSRSRLEALFLQAFNQILNIDTQTDFAFTRHGFGPDNVVGSAGLYYVVTAVIGNLILSNLIVTVIGERYTLALEANRSSQWSLELNRHLAHKRVMLKLQDDCIAALLRNRPFWRGKRFWGARQVMLMWATLFEAGWKPYGLRMYPWDETRVLYESVEMRRLPGEVVDVQ